MARAKRTERASARRRARLAAADVSLEHEGSDDAPLTRTAGGSGGSGTASPGPVRAGLFGAFRGAYRPVHFRQDLRDIPWLVTRTRAVWIPSLLVIVSAVWFGASGGRGDNFSALAFQIFIYPPPALGAGFLAGILTPRMGYMAGGLVGIVEAATFAVYMAVGPIVSATPLTADQKASYVFYALILSPLAGVAVGGAAAFYRRFLALSNPSRGKPAPAKKPAKSSKPGGRR